MKRNRCLLLVLTALFIPMNKGLAQNVNAQLSEKFKQIDANKNDSLALLSLEQLAKTTQLSVPSQLAINYRLIQRQNALQKFNVAIALGNQNIVLARSNKMDSMEAVFYKLLGASYYFMDRRRAAVPYFQKSLDIATRNNYWELEAVCNNNIGGALTDVQEYKLAEPYLLKSISIMKQHGKESAPSTLNTYRVLARYYSESGKPERAEELYLILIEKSKEIQDTSLLSDILLFYSDLLSQRGEYKKAVEMSSEALALIRKIKGPHELQMGLTIQALNLYNAGKYKEAYESIEESKTLLRSVFATDLEKEISEVEVKYKTAELRHEKELAEIRTKKQRQIYLFSFFGIVLFASAGLYNWNQKKNTKQKMLLSFEKAEAEKLRFKEVIEAEEKERSRIAQELHDGLGQLLSTARLNVAGLEDAVSKEDQPDLERSLKIIDDACEEVRSISHNMMPSALIRLGLIPAINELVINVNAAKGVKIDFTYNEAISLSKSLEISIYRVIQEVLNNMLKHAKATLISLSIEKSNADLTINIKDNGIGFETEDLKKSTGIGWKNIYSRISMLDGSINLASELQHGTEVNIKLKLKDA